VIKKNIFAIHVQSNYGESFFDNDKLVNHLRAEIP